MTSEVYDVLVVGGGPVGLATAYEVAKTNKNVIVLEQNNFFNQAGSSGDLARMFRTMYTEDFMADLAKDAMGLWDDLEKDAGLSLRLMSGLLNFGDADIGKDSPEGTLTGPIENLKRLNMSYSELNAQEIQAKYPFKNLNPDWIGLYAPDNGVINVQQLLRTLLGLAKDYGAKAKQQSKVQKIVPKSDDPNIWEVHSLANNQTTQIYLTKKVVIASGAYTNHILKPSFGISLDLDIWEMVATYYNANAGPNGTLFPSMWFQFAPNSNNRSQLFYGMPALPWGPPNTVRIAVDAATNRIKDPDERQSSIFSPEDISDTQDFVRDHVVGVDWTVPASTISCLQTNVYDNMFVLDFVPKKYLNGGPENSVAVFTAGWAMKFVPLLGAALAGMALQGSSEFALPEFSMTRNLSDSGKGIINPAAATLNERFALEFGESYSANSAFSFALQAEGSSQSGKHNVGR